MQAAQLELQKLEAEVGELMARAQVQASKAEATTQAEEFKLAELQSRIGLKREELQMRIQLALLSSQTRKQEMGSKMLAESARLETQKAIAMIQAQRNNQQTPKR